jgi:hypothetical protein
MSPESLLSRDQASAKAALKHFHHFRELHAKVAADINLTIEAMVLVSAKLALFLGDSSGILRSGTDFLSRPSLRLAPHMFSFKNF